MFAMLPVLPPGVNRFWCQALNLDDPIPTFWLYLTLWGMAAALLTQEWRETKAISRYSLFGTAFIVIEGAVHEAVVGSAWFSEFSRMVLGLAVYRSTPKRAAGPQGRPPARRCPAAQRRDQHRGRRPGWACAVNRIPH